MSHAPAPPACRPRGERGAQEFNPVLRSAPPLLPLLRSAARGWSGRFASLAPPIRSAALAICLICVCAVGASAQDLSAPAAPAPAAAGAGHTSVGGEASMALPDLSSVLFRGVTGRTLP